ncbi:MAG: glycosyltransferase [Nitrosomonadales bacterium]|nr:glycosyltransferase [Nitrosomonadales bacterium]
MSATTAGNSVPKLMVGELLISRGLLTQAQLDEALVLQKKWGTRIGDIVLAKGWIKPLDFYSALAFYYQKPFVDMLKEPPDVILHEKDDLAAYNMHQFMPWRITDDDNPKVIIATSNPNEQAMDLARQRFGDNVDFVITSKFDILWQLQHHHDEYFTHNAIRKLAEQMPEHSASVVITKPQLIFVATVITLVLIVATVWPMATFVGMNLAIAGLLLMTTLARLTLTWVGSDRHIDIKVTDHEVKLLKDEDLPVYTVLMPMYKEEAILPFLAKAMRELDYPLSKLDIKLVLEQDDEGTVNAAKALGLEAFFEIIRVPTSFPKTKPKACNYALNFARGKFITIYDGEDRPEPDQLKKVIIAFSGMAENVACVQARLNYFNSTENWLTRMFTLEYSLWFDFFLPGLEALKIPIPLGGTSNHFKAELLLQFDGWDPYNVAEDADLGVRFTQCGYRVGIVNSTTYEEACNHVPTWIRQRSRWIKGYMQAYLVHMRAPIELYRSIGSVGFWGFQFFFLGAFFSYLVAPFLYGTFVIWILGGAELLDPLFPPLVLLISLFNLTLGNGSLVYMLMVGAFKRQNYMLIPYALTVPYYWLLMSIAAYKALSQLIFNPFYWEKTTHGISTHLETPAAGDQPAAAH